MHTESREHAVQVHRTDTHLEPSTNSTDESSSPYRRDNWYGDTSTSEAEPAMADASVLHTGTTKEEWVAMTILRRNATVLCPYCLAEEGGPEVELSNPTEHVPRVIIVESPHGPDIMVELAIMPKRHRVCPRCGAETFGGPLARRSFEEFRTILDEVVASAKIAEYPPSQLRKARSDALAAKGRGDDHDVEIMSQFIRQLTTGDEPDDTDD